MPNEHKTGAPGILNRLTGVTSIIQSTTAEMSQIDTPLPAGIAIYNEDTGELKVGDGSSVPASLPDHKHPFTYSPLGHTHMFGANEPWLMSNPRLWYSDDLSNHPELVALDGSDISSDRAEHLSTVYPGVKLITDPITTISAGVFSNDDMQVTCSAFGDPFYPAHLFGDEITVETISEVYKQWLTNDDGLLTEQWIKLNYGTTAYRPTMYLICPASGVGDLPFKKRPTPKHWYLEGSNDDSTWTVVDEHNETVDQWAPFSVRVFEVDTLQEFKYLRLRIAEWFSGDAGSPETGLRRFWVFGRQNGVFSLPNIPSPNPDFVWVVPYNNLNVGLKHEEVGDIGFTSISAAYLPYYRLPADGRVLSKSTDALLFASIAHQFDHEYAVETATTSSGTVTTTGTWNPGLSAADDPAYIQFAMDGSMLGYYRLQCTSKCTPQDWIVEGSTDGGSTWTTLQTLTDISKSTFLESDGTFVIDTTTTDLALTHVRINVLEWNSEEDVPYGFSLVQLYTHPVGQFYIPSIQTNDGTLPYIVRENSVDDVSVDVIQRLQANIAALTRAQAALANRVDNLDPEVHTSGSESESSSD